MTVLDVWQFASNSLGLLSCLGGIAAFVALMWLRNHFFTRKDGETLTARVGALEESVSHLPTASEVKTLTGELTEIKRSQAVQGEKLNGMYKDIKRMGQQNNTIYNHLLSGEK